MHSPIAPETKTVRGAVLRRDPAREACFRLVHLHQDMEDYGDMSEASRRQRLHQHMHNEMQSLEIAAQCLVDFPETSWELRMELARQCWDESRHIAGLHRRLTEVGGRKGEFPISAFEWNVTCALDNLPGRLASQNRTFEAGALDVVGGNLQAWRDAGDPETADVLDAILADEIQHVRFANRWLKTYIQQDRRTLFQIAAAVRFVAQANAVLQARGDDPAAVDAAKEQALAQAPAVNVEDRRLAEFTDDEIHEILKQAGFRSLLPEPASGPPA